jgi:hypothetical protein
LHSILLERLAGIHIGLLEDLLRLLDLAHKVRLADGEESVERHLERGSFCILVVYMLELGVEEDDRLVLERDLCAVLVEFENAVRVGEVPLFDVDSDLVVVPVALELVR